ncbi:MAG: hypothetical protein HFJ26_00760 [Clostridia bacterium]|jgi:uncharacterized Zn finger protein (UPF0148 family)|nr:hypothetical protein [Clostridia bacterium]
MEKLTCSSCGASDYTKLPNGNLKCNYCGTEYSQSSTPEEEVAKNAQTWRDVEVTGMHHSDLNFIVHKKLEVSGMNNRIIFHTSLENAEHVATLEVSGMEHCINVVLTDGATYSSSGMGHKFNVATRRFG